MKLTELLLINLAVISGAMLLLWLVSIALRNASIVDVFWGPAFAIVALIGWFLGDGDHDRRTLLAALTAAWGLRLGMHLAQRNLGHGEDPRYVRWRKRVQDAGGNFTRHSLVMAFAMQGLLVIIVSLPVQAGQIAVTNKPLGTLALVGTLLWLVGFLFEAIGDWQLLRFKAEPANRGRLLDTGLWCYTRHPNYFGNACSLVGPVARRLWCTGTLVDRHRPGNNDLSAAQGLGRHIARAIARRNQPDVCRVPAAHQYLYSLAAAPCIGSRPRVEELK